MELTVLRVRAWLCCDMASTASALRREALAVSLLVVCSLMGPPIREQY
jgi:hypothetical protein